MPWQASAVLLGLAYWLWEEGQLGLHMASQPDYVPESGGRYESLGALLSRYSLVFFSMSLLLGLTVTYFLRHRRLVSHPYVPAVVLRLASISLASGIHLAMAAIEAFVWEGADPDLILCPMLIVGFIVIGGGAVARTYHAYEGQASGAALELSQEQEDDLHDLLKAGPKKDFKKRLRMARKQYLDWTGADPWVVNQALSRMWSELSTVYADQVPPRYTLIKVFFALIFLIGALVLVRLGLV